MPDLHAWEGSADPATGDVRRYVCPRCRAEIPALAVLVGMVIFAVLVFAVCSGVAMILDGHL